MTASFEGHVDIVRMFIEAKAQINTQDEVYTCMLYFYHQHFIITLSATVAAVFTR